MIGPLISRAQEGRVLDQRPLVEGVPGTFCVDGTAEVAGGRLFFAAYDECATWFSDLKPAFGASRFLPGLDAV
ncbi:hypothetical protein [Streptomyces sp. NPDC091209]|uniref:hypothetical protein n=1 Tax=Streptomyces sp. NPDC091209 TaxID=3365974 RepID=UPI00382A365D